SHSSRHELWLRQSSDGRNWLAPFAVEADLPGDAISYPNMVLAGESLWVSFTNKSESIAWKRFSLSAPVTSDSSSREYMDIPQFTYGRAAELTPVSPLVTAGRHLGWGLTLIAPALFFLTPLPASLRRPVA